MRKDIKGRDIKMRKDINLIIRGYKILASFPKPILLSKALAAFTRASVPFINIWFSARILNELAGARDPDRLLVLVLLTIGLNLLGSMISHALRQWDVYCSSQTWQSVYKVFTDKMLSMDYIDVEDPNIQKELSEIRYHHLGMGFGLARLIRHYEGIIDGVIRIVVSVAFAFSMFTYSVQESSSLAFLDSPLAVVAVLMLLSCSIFLAPYLTTIGGRIWVKASEINNHGNRLGGNYIRKMIYGTDGAKDIRIYDQKRLIKQSISSTVFIVKQWGEFAKYDGKFKVLSTGVSYLANGLIYLFVALKAFGGAFGVGNIVQYVGAITQFSNGFALVLTNFGELKNNNVYLERVINFLDIPNKKYQGTIPVEKRDDNDYEIEFKNVSFKYPGSEQYALKNLSMKLHVGQRLAVVGMNGSGKTTMIKLLCRLYDPTEGEITLNGIDIKKYNYDEYMGIFGVVFQDFTLLPFTLGQNVAASVQYDEDRVNETLIQSGFETKIDQMPKGLETYLYKNFEEDGVEVSGGEAQKIALARALYKNAPFIVLDEPTAALDPIAEYEIYSAFNEIVGDKTAVYISHRLSSCRFCDDIAVFHEGEMVQRGSHEVLVADENGKYCELWNAQAQYYTEPA